MLKDGLAPDFETEFDGPLGKAQIGGSIPPCGSPVSVTIFHGQLARDFVVATTSNRWQANYRSNDSPD
jgi:hypothetical protein